MESVARALRQISPDRAEALILTYFGGLSNLETGRLRGKSEAAVKMLISRGLQDLRAYLPCIGGGTMNDKFTNNMNSDDENLARKLDQVADQTIINTQFASELEQRLRTAHQPRLSWLVRVLIQTSLPNLALGGPGNPVGTGFELEHSITAPLATAWD